MDLPSIFRSLRSSFQFQTKKISSMPGSLMIGTFQTVAQTAWLFTYLLPRILQFRQIKKNAKLQSRDIIKISQVQPPKLYQHIASQHIPQLYCGRYIPYLQNVPIFSNYLTTCTSGILHNLRFIICRQLQRHFLISSYPMQDQKQSIRR